MLQIPVVERDIPEADMGYFRILGAIPGFFISALILWALWTPVTERFGWADIGYTTAMLITITLWLVVAPLAAVGGSRKK